MATAIGTNTITSLVRHYIFDEIADNVYGGNPTFFRWNSMGKKMIQGTTQIEAPLMYARWSNGGWYTGYQQLQVDPSDTIKNGAWDWRQAYVPVSLDGLTLLKSDSPEAIANVVTVQFKQAEMELAEVLGAGLWSDGSNTQVIDGLKGAVDDNTVLATYAGLLRSSNTWWKSQMDTSTATLTLTAMQTMWGNCTKGGRHPTVIFATQANYNRYWVLNQTLQAFPVQPQGHDEQLAQSGFSNLLFNGCPILVDAHVPANHMFFLNEDYIYFCVSPRGDFQLEDFQVPIQQDAIVAKLLWAGNLVINNVQLQGKMTALTA